MTQELLAPTILELDYDQVIYDAIVQLLLEKPKDLREHLQGACSQKDFKEISRFINRVRDETYPKVRRRKTGDLPLDFTEDMFKKFIRAVRNPHMRLRYLVMFFCGPRPCECPNITLVPGRDLFRIENGKVKDAGQGVMDHRPVYHPLIRELLERYLSDPWATNYSTAYGRKYFNKTLKRLPEEFRYVAFVDKKGQGRKPLRQYSIRHTSGNLVRRGMGEAAEKWWLRHTMSAAFGVTGHYMHFRCDEMVDGLLCVFSPYFDLLRELFVDLDTL